MTEYQWNNGTIKRVVVEHGRKYPNAFIEAAPDCRREEYHELLSNLQAFGLQTFADTHEGRPALRVQGFETDAELMQDLQRTKMLPNPPDHIRHDLAKHKPGGVAGLKQWVTDNSMVAAGISYLVADGLVFGSGYVRGDKNGIQQGLVWSATSAMLVMFGNRNPAQQMQSMYGKMGDYFREQGYELTPEHAQTLEKLKGKSDHFYNRALQFFYEHPVEINNTLQGWGGVQLTLAGLNQKSINPHNPLIASARPNYFKVLAGICVASGMWGGMLIPEDKQAGLSEEEKSQQFLDRLQGHTPPEKKINPLDHPIDWIKQSPLRITGIGASANNILVGAGAILMERPDLNRYFDKGGVRERFKAKLQADEAAIHGLSGTAQMEAFAELRDAKAGFAELDKKQINRKLGRQFDQWTPVPNLIANWLYGMSPKDRRGMLKEDGYLEELYTMASNIFISIPAAEREDRIKKFAGFMELQPDMKSTASEIEAAVRDKLAQLEQNPWRAAQSEIEVTRPAVPSPDTHTSDIQHQARLTPDAPHAPTLH